MNKVYRSKMFCILILMSREIASVVFQQRLIFVSVSKQSSLEIETSLVLKYLHCILFIYIIFYFIYILFYFIYIIFYLFTSYLIILMNLKYSTLNYEKHVAVTQSAHSLIPRQDSGLGSFVPCSFTIISFL